LFKKEETPVSLLGSNPQTGKSLLTSSAIVTHRFVGLQFKVGV
jgi:hypothetical protein